MPSQQSILFASGPFLPDLMWRPILVVGILFGVATLKLGLTAFSGCGLWIGFGNYSKSMISKCFGVVLIAFGCCVIVPGIWMIVRDLISVDLP